MQTVINTKRGLFRQVVTPNEHRNNIPIPKEWYGKRIGVILYPMPVEPDKQQTYETAQKSFRVNRRRLETMRVSGNPAMTSENLIRADRDAR